LGLGNTSCGSQFVGAGHRSLLVAIDGVVENSPPQKSIQKGSGLHCCLGAFLVVVGGGRGVEGSAGWRGTIGYWEN